MAPRPDPVEPTPALPPRTDVVIIGGGIVGTSTALFLAQKGVATLLCEKGHIAGEQSSRNWGWCRTMGRDPREVPLALESLRLWRQMNTLTGAETGFRAAGTAYLCDTPQQLATHETWIEAARAHQIPTRLLTPDEIDATIPGSTRRWAGAVVTPGDGRAEPTRAAPAIARAAQAHGAAIATACAVRGIETAAGRVSAVVTEHGRVACSAIVLAGGAWSRLFCGPLGIDLPQLKVLGSVMRTEPLAGPPDIATGAPDFAFRKRLDGGYTIARRGVSTADIVPDSLRLLPDFGLSLFRERGELRLRIGRRFVEEWRLPRHWSLDAASPFERVRTLDPEPVDTILDEGRANLVAAFPAFKDMVIAERWAGLIDVTPDAVPVISSVASLPGFHIATGFSGHGFGIGPGAGRLMAQLVTGDTPIVDPTPFRLNRFPRTANT